MKKWNDADKYKEMVTESVSEFVDMLDIATDVPNSLVKSEVLTTLGKVKITVVLDTSVQRGTEWDR